MYSPKRKLRSHVRACYLVGALCSLLVAATGPTLAASAVGLGCSVHESQRASQAVVVGAATAIKELGA